MKKFRFHFVFAICFGIALELIFWLITDENSPLEIFFSDATSLQNAIGLLHIIPLIIATIVSGNIHGSTPSGDVAYWTTSMVQWIIPGFFLALIFKPPRSNGSRVKSTR